MKKLIGNNCFIIAELSANHGGDLNIALETVRAAKRAGANAIKLQTFTADTITFNNKGDDFLINQGATWDGRYLYDLYKETMLPWEWHEPIFKEAKKCGLICFSSPFDSSSVEFLEKLDVPAYKIASPEITDIPLIEFVASKGKPVIISTGIATDDDIILAIEACHRKGNKDIALLKCTSSYPAPLEEANLIMIQEFAKKYNVIPGLSDHTLGIIAPIVAVTLGAKIIEKHFVLNKAVNSVDASFSLDEIAFTQMVNAVRQAEKAIGEINFNLTKKQGESRNFARSLYIVKNVKKGDIVTEENVKSIRPGYGLHPKYFNNVMGCEFTCDINKGSRLSFDLLKTK